jgi:hypothetical protein
MYKRLFSTQRCLQRRNDIITPPGGVKKKRSEWVISRSLCYYQLFSLEEIPNNRQEDVLNLKIKQWAPFQEYSNYSVWQGKQAQVWIWDKEQQENLLTETGIKKVTIMPETVLRPHPTTDTIQLIQCIEGVEGQIWKDGLLKASRWWAEMPNEKEWELFQRSHSLQISDNLPPPLPLEQELLNRPWGKPKRHLSRNQLYQERIMVILGATIFTALLTWQTISVWKWQQAIDNLQNQIEVLNGKISPILVTRNKAIIEKKRCEQLLALAPHPSQLELMTVVLEKLPSKKKKTALIRWFYQKGELRFTVETSQLDPTFYVETFQKIPLFKEVNVKKGTGRNSNQMTINMKL